MAHSAALAALLAQDLPRARCLAPRFATFNALTLAASAARRALCASRCAIRAAAC